MFNLEQLKDIMMFLRKSVWNLEYEEFLVLFRLSILNAVSVYVSHIPERAAEKQNLKPGLLPTECNRNDNEA